MDKNLTFKINFIPDAPSYKKMLEAMLGEPLVLVYDFGNQEAFAIFSKEEQLENLYHALPGIKLSSAGDPKIAVNGAILLKPYCMASQKDFSSSTLPISDIYEMLQGEKARMAIAFVPSTMDYVRLVKGRLENELSRAELRLTKNNSLHKGISIFSSYQGATQVQLYYNYGERLIMESMLSMLNDILLSNGISYKALFIIEDNQKLLRYISQKLMLLESEKISLSSLSKFYEAMGNIDSLPFSIERASQFIVFPDKIKGGIKVKTRFTPEQGNINVGAFMRDSLEESGEQIYVEPNIFNLGIIIAGLPGTGKTREAMSIVKQLLNAEKRPGIAVISPSEEWNSFALENGLRLVRLYGSKVKINFFKCDAQISIEKFYENLAMLIAFASNAGPYRNPLEKCLLAAFHKVYKNTRSPDPLELYDTIEEAVIEQHGKRTNAGVKYTKHGENIRAALENLRIMLFREEFSSSEGADFGELLKHGVVFDLSRVSNNMKPFFYALILNQIYSFSDSFDVMGDSELRMLMCLEEAQLVFSADEHAATTVDLEQRIQDFRKRGIGLMLIAHGVTEINQNIRRICQNKFYFRQSSDIAKYAVMDLGFRESELDTVIDKLKSLEQRVCIFSHVSRNAAVLATHQGPIFVKTPEYNAKQIDINGEHEGAQRKPSVGIRIKIVDDAGNPISGAETKLTYVGEEVGSGRTNENGEIFFPEALQNRMHVLIVYIKKNKPLYFKVTSKDQTISVQAQH